jgi:hypothetical protein
VRDGAGQAHPARAVDCGPPGCPADGDGRLEIGFRADGRLSEPTYFLWMLLPPPEYASLDKLGELGYEPE